MSRPLAVALLSGGPDALVAARLVQKEGVELVALFVDYGQRTAARERRAALATATWLSVRRVIEERLNVYAQVSSAAMLAGAIGVRHEHAISEYVPFRNTVLLSLAVVCAESLGATAVVIGSTGSDHTSPDNSPAFISAMQAVVDTGTVARNVTVRAPLIAYDKHAMVRCGANLGIPFELTWSCQNQEDNACGVCNNCLARRAAFTSAGVVDPVNAAAD